MKLPEFNLCVGTGGTLATIELGSINTIAAIAAGFCTAAWMLTQMLISISRYRREIEKDSKK